MRYNSRKHTICKYKYFCYFEALYLKIFVANEGDQIEKKTGVQFFFKIDITRGTWVA